MEMNEKDKILYEFIKDFMLKNHYPPTTRDMLGGLGVTSTNSVFMHFQRLVKMGYVTKHGSKKYSVKGIEYVEVS